MKPFEKENAVVLFQGDSVTDCGRDRDQLAAAPGVPCRNGALGEGYPLIVKSLYDLLFPGNHVTFVNRGVSGDRSMDLLIRYDEDVRAVRPDFMSVLIGVNNTWRRFDSDDPTSRETFYDEYDRFLSRTLSDLPDMRLMLIEPFALLSHPDRRGWDDDLAEKREVTRALAEKYHTLFLPAHSLMERHLSVFAPDALSPDGVHPAPQGHALLAKAWLELVI